MRNHHGAVFGVACSLILLISCKISGPDEGGVPVQSENAQAPVVSVAPPPSAALLPAFVSELDCDRAPPALSACGWALTQDAVVWGQITAIRLIDQPAVIQDGARYVSATNCQTVAPAMEIDLMVSRSLVGSLGGKITFRIGEEQLTYFVPAAVRGGAASIGWLPSSPRFGGKPLAVGQMLGAELSYAQDAGAWTLMGGMLFSNYQDANGRELIAFQTRVGSCIEPTPAGLDGLPIAQFLASVASCKGNAAAVDEATGRRSVLSKSWGPESGKPHQYATALCFGPAAVECLEPCIDGLVCVNGVCQ